MHKTSPPWLWEGESVQLGAWLLSSPETTSRLLTGLRTGTWHMPILTEPFLFHRPAIANSPHPPSSIKHISLTVHLDRMWGLFFHAAWAMGKQPTGLFFYESPWTPGHPGSCYSSEWLFFPLVWRSNHTERSVCTDPRLFTLATSPAAGLLFSHFSWPSGKVLKAVFPSSIDIILFRTEWKPVYAICICNAIRYKSVHIDCMHEHCFVMQSFSLLDHLLE